MKGGVINGYKQFLKNHKWLTMYHFLIIDKQLYTCIFWDITVHIFKDDTVLVRFNWDGSFWIYSLKYYTICSCWLAMFSAHCTKEKWSRIQQIWTNSSTILTKRNVTSWNSTEEERILSEEQNKQTLIKQQWIKVKYSFHFLMTLLIVTSE